MSDRRFLFVLQRAARAATNHVSSVTLERLGVSVAQLGTLSYVAQKPGCTMTEVADVLDLNKSAASGMLSRLERAELVTREPNPRDGRGACLSLTPKGEQVRAASRSVFRRTMADLTEGVSQAELETTLKVLNLLVARCSEQTSEDD